MLFIYSIMLRKVYLPIKIFSSNGKDRTKLLNSREASCMQHSNIFHSLIQDRYVETWIFRDEEGMRLESALGRVPVCYRKIK